jgi:DNA processing protein
MTIANADELPAWLRLLTTPGVGRGGARQLLAAFGVPQAVFDASAAQRRDCVDAAVATALDDEPSHFAGLLSSTRAWLDGAADRDWITLGDARYPQGLLQTADPPLLLYTQGRSELLNSPCLAIVCSRNPTPLGT